MMRAFEAMRERNLLDAWKNGGEFEGKRVTDEIMLKHFDDKLAGLDPNDPLYDEAHNTAEQYRFAVRNSKMELGYANKSVGDAGMASFYRKEAANHPRDSEAWRNLMKLSAQYAHRVSTGGGGGGGGGSAARKAYNKAVLATKIEYPQGREQAWDVWKAEIIDLARKTHILNSDKQDFSDLQPAELDFQHLGSLIDEFANSPQFAARREQLTDWIRKNGDPSFDGDFTMHGVVNMRADKVKGMDSRLDLAQRKGTKTQINKINKDKTSLAKESSAINLVDPITLYEEGRATRDKIVLDPKSSVLDRIEANNEWAEQLSGIASSVGGTVYDNADGGQNAVIFGRLNGELLSLTGDVDGSKGTASLQDEGRSSTAHAPGDPSQSDNATTAEMVNKDNVDYAMLMSGHGVLTKIGSDGKPTDQPGGVWGVIDYQTLYASAPAGTFLIHNAQPTGSIKGPMVDPVTGDWARDPVTGNVKIGSQSTSTVMTAVPFQTITVTGQGALDAAGRPTTTLKFAPKTRADIGGVADLGDGDMVYRFQDSDGNIKYTTAPWWKEKMEDDTPVDVVNGVAEGKGIQLTAFGGETGNEKFDPYSVEQTTRKTPAGWKPTDVIDGFTYDAATNVLSLDVFTSAFIAAAVAKDTIDTLTPAQIVKGIGVETGDATLQSDVAQNAMKEADKVKAQAVVDRANVKTTLFMGIPTGPMKGSQWTPDELTTEEKKAMPDTAKAVNDILLGQAEDRLRSQYGDEGVRKVRDTALKIMGAVGAAVDPTGALGLSDMLRNGLRNSMNGVTKAAATDPTFMGPSSTDIVRRAVTGSPGFGQPVMKPPTTAYQGIPSTPKPPAPAPVVNPYVGFTTPAPAPKPPASAPVVNPYVGFVIPPPPTTPPPPKAVRGPSGAPQPF